MLSGHRSARRRRSNKSRAVRIAVPLAIPMALGLTLGIILAVSGGNSTNIQQSALGSCASAAASGGASAAPAASASQAAPATGASAPAAAASTPAAASSAAAAPCPSASGSATAAAAAGAAAAANFAIPPNNAPNRAGLAGANAVDAAGNAFSFNQTAAQAAASMNCDISVPANPLTAQGLATPFQLGDGCTWANGGTEGTFVEATILSPNGQVTVYDPLVITQGTTPAVAPVAPTIAAGSQVIISFGFNGNALALVGPGARQGNCVDAFGNSLINQTPQCNAASFYRMANAEIARGTLKVPPAGTGGDGQACQTTRDFGLIDQDQSDNVVASYLFNPATGQTAQATAANAGNQAGATLESNGSDNGLLNNFVDKALNCTPFTAPNPTNPNGTSGSQALDELSARANQKGTIALLPVNDPQLLVGGNFSIGKTNTYRIENDQPALFTSATQNAARYCMNLVNIQTPRLKLDAAMETGTASPVPALGNNLATFLAARLSGSFGNLNCQNFGLTNPVTLTVDGNGVATAATFNTAQQTAKVTGTTRGAGAGRAGGGARNRANFMMGRRGHM
jgi:hypothetical protein